MEGRDLYTGQQGRKRSVYWPQWKEEICILANSGRRDFYTGQNGRKKSVYWPTVEGRDLYTDQQWKEEIFILAKSGRKRLIYWPQ